MNVLLFGGSGLLGRALTRIVPASWAVTSPSSGECDIGDPSAPGELIARLRPTLVINAAAYTAVDAAEDAVEAADRVNTDAPGYIASACENAGARLVHIGSDYVFDGRADRPYREDDPTNPISAYGRSKLGGERAVLERSPAALVVRTQWLFGVGARTLVSVMQERAQRGQPARVVSDQRGRPTYAADLAAVLVDVAPRTAVTGLLHVTNDGEASSYELAAAVYRHYGNEHLVQPTTTAEFGARAVRPAYSPLALERLHGLGIRTRDWHDALTDYLTSSATVA